MKEGKGIAYCGLACCLCSQNDDCAGCRNDGCENKDWCKSFKCCREKEIEGCWKCEEFPCDNPMFNKLKIRSFAAFAEKYGEAKLLECLKRNEQNGAVYHYDRQITGDYDELISESEIEWFLINGKRNRADFLKETEYINYSSHLVQECSRKVFANANSSMEKAKAAYLFVRDNIQHSFDFKRDEVTVSASDVIKEGTGICHGEANLLAALLRLQGIPCGFKFQRLTLDDDASMGYCIHVYNAAFIDGKWISLDARGNNKKIHTIFSADEASTSFVSRKQYGEYDIDGIFANPHTETMSMLERAENLQDVLDSLPDSFDMKPDIE